MSILTDSLEKIVNWQQVNDTESIADLRPGLSDSKIDELIQDFPLFLPISRENNSGTENIAQPLSLILLREVREIYHYCNGAFELTLSLS